MKKLYVAVALSLGLASPILVRAQVDFRPGYIVRPAGDTARGEVDYRDARFNARQCRFRATPSAQATTFSPTELRAYGLRDAGRLRQYRTLVPPTTTPTTSTTPAPVGSEAPAFLEVLVNGPASLYYLRDAERADHYYVATAAFPLTELIQRKVLLEQQRILQQQNIYRTTLAQALPGCPAAQAQLPALTFTSAALARAVATYNQCQAPAGSELSPEVAPARVPGPKVQIGLVLGGQLTSLHIEYGGQYYGESNVDFGPKAAVTAGVAFTVPLSALSHKLALEAELLYETESYDRRSAVGGYGNTLRYTFGFKHLRLPLLVRYTFPKGAVRPFIEAGPTIAWALKQENTLQVTDPQGQTSTLPYLYQGNFQRLQEGLGGGVGLQFGYWQGRQAALLARYETDTGWGSGQGLNTWSNRFYALLTLGLTK